MSEEKTKPPTDKKLQDAHKDGESAKSPDATAAGVLLMAAAMLWTSASYMQDRLARLFALVWLYLPKTGEPLSGVIAGMVGELFLLTVPFALVTLMGAVISLILQGAMTMSAKPVLLKFNTINPVQGIKKIISMRAGIEAVMMLVKSVVLGTLLYHTLVGLFPLLVGSTARTPSVLAALIWLVLMRLLFTGVGFFVVFGLLDYGLQRFLFIRDHRMDDEELKRESKENNGNPEVKQTRKALANELMMSDPHEAVGKANMLVMNPTHYAVAIFYENGDLPRIVAKGLNQVALDLRTCAERAGVPVIVSPALARTLYKVPLGSSIPSDCFHVVGVMLHWVDQLRASRAGSPTSTEPANTLK